MNITLIIVLIVAAGFGAAAFILMSKLKGKEKQLGKMGKENVNYQSIIEQANDAMLVIDIVDGRVHQSNPSAAHMLGYTREQLAKKSLFDLHPKELLDKSSRIVADVWEKGGMIYKDIPFVTASGEVLPVECSAKVAPFSGRPAIVIYARDIRERLRMEREIQVQNEIIEQKNKDILDSIEYARNIQQAVLPDKNELQKMLPQSFLFFKAKDIVSGDFYWFAKSGDEVLVAAADCTGHGVPGALMSMIGSSYLNEIVNERKITQPAQVLNLLREKIINTLRKRQDGSETRDGMDIALLNLNLKTNLLQYAGAFNPLWMYRDGQWIEKTANKFPIGAYVGHESNSFTNHEIPLQKKDMIYIFTDGYADQFGGPQGKKFKYKKFQEVLTNIQDNTMEEQKQVLLFNHEDWRGDLEQVDDILVIGIRIE
jgi:PAS domain S-box-containing protein